MFFCLVVVWFLFVLPQGPFSEDDVGDHDNSLRSTIKVTPGRKSNATVAVFLHFHLALAYEKTVADWTKQERWGRGAPRETHTAPAVQCPTESSPTEPSREKLINRRSALSPGAVKTKTLGPARQPRSPAGDDRFRVAHRLSDGYLGRLD